MDEMDRYLKKCMGFRPNTDVLSPESITYLKSLQNRREFSLWMSKAIEFYRWYELYPRGFLMNLLNEDYELCRALLRKIGRSRRRKFENENK